MSYVTKILVNGIVQGVGFRPFIYALAKERGLNGSVQNTPNGVEIVLQCDEQDADSFINEMKAKLPPLANIETIEKIVCQTENNFTDFNILETQQGSSATRIPADTAICDSCLDDIFNPQSRYYLYPYTSCTHCGPRYSVIEDLPYDRANTTYIDFPLCNDCQKAYSNPLDRRFHAQAIACQKCGPELSSSFADIALAMNSSKIVALKSQNGFRLVVNAFDNEAVQNLRLRKHRPNKPFALMALNTESIKKYVYVNEVEQELLESQERPIVILEDKKSSKLSEQIAPNLNKLGFMLPATGMDYLLFYNLLGRPKGVDWLKEANNIVLVVTSANISGDSIIAENEEAIEKLKNIADVIVTDNRRIAMKSDDSVLHVISDKPLMIRRARGFVPKAIKLAENLDNVLATGTFLKNTFCLINGSQAYLSQYIGDMASQDNIDYYHEVLTHYQKLFNTDIKAMACDMHPDIYTSQFAQNFDLPIYKIQHHQAHLAAVIAEHGLQGQAIGLVLDGFGLGEDGVARGGELYSCDIDNINFKRVGELAPVPYLGGDNVAKEPWRIALALCKFYNISIPTSIKKYKGSEALEKALVSNDSLPVTTSMGRIFDAVSSLLDICHINTYEAEAAMRLEALASEPVCRKELVSITKDNKLDLSLLIKEVLQVGDKAQASDLWHGTLALAMAEWIGRASDEQRTSTVILSGGCFQNKILLSQVIKYLKLLNLKVYISEKVPVNDGGVSLGQAWLAAKLLQKENKLCA
ncbi:carbamoyltransferase HypF [Pseudofrancisella aestuarii]|uniref:Carbamoyltransferase HypF n=1 Tax=Pseudofrancisella aestuarii TaxID=2670347 RepID=A0ABV9TD76_9GAMM|nr:carbamoyltransferase HypF [Pseudofrancisella aestuarii]